jgi:retinoblastoma-like protein 1
MDNETCVEAWRSYEHICKHYLLEGDQLHWLAVSLYVSCRKNKNSINNPISISRLLKSANELKLLIFFDKLHKWIDMENLPDQLRKKIDQIESSFNISSIIFQKYFQIFIQIFGGNEEKLNEFNYSEQRKSIKINPKLNHLYKQSKLSHYHLYQFIWTIYSLSKTIYPPTSNDLIASFHLLLASFIFVYLFIKKSKLDYLIKGNYLNECYDDKMLIIDRLSNICNCSSSMLNVIYEEYFKNGLFKEINLNEISLLNEKTCFEMINKMNNEYDEIVLRNCIIDERIFLENKNQLNDLLNSFNENRNQKTIDNRTPLTANQHLTFISNEILTPISQANQLIHLLNLIIQNQDTKPTDNLSFLIGQQPFLNDLIQRINQWEQIFISQYNLNEDNNHLFGSAKYRFDFSLKLFYLTLENILMIEKKRLISNHFNDQFIQKSFHKLILNNEFLKSLLGLCLLLIFYAHSDQIHDLNWILNIYSLHAYSFLKIIQIFLKSSKEINQSRSFIKYLSSIEEIILSSMIFSDDSPLWNDIQTKGILSYSDIHSKQLFKSPSNHNLTNTFNQSPNSNHVKRKLFTTTVNILLLIIKDLN